MTAERRCGAVEACSDRSAVPAGVPKCPIVLQAFQWRARWPASFLHTGAAQGRRATRLRTEVVGMMHGRSHPPPRCSSAQEHGLG